MKKANYLAAALALAMLAPACAAAQQIAVSVNDGKQTRPGEAPSTRTEDYVSVIDISGRTPRVVGNVAAPTSMIGPPTSVAVASDESFAIVASAQAIENGVLVKNDQVSLLDLRNPAAPRVVQTIQGGSGATGVAINRARTLALVANTGDDSISIFTIANNQLTPAGRVRLDYQSRPTDVAFAPDGSFALAVQQAGNRIVRLDVNGSTVTRSNASYAPGLQPYGVVVSRDGRYAFNTNLGGRAPAPGESAASGGGRISTVSVTDLSTYEVVTQIDVGMTSEHVALSPDGRYIAVVVLNGSTAQPGAPNYNDHSLLQIYSVNGAELTRVAEARTGKWCQGAVFNRNNTQIVLQCAMDRQIEIYRFNGHTLTADPRATMNFNARPGAITTSADR